MEDLDPVFAASPPAPSALKKVKRPVARIPGTTKTGAVGATYVSEETWAHAIMEVSQGKLSLREVARRHKVSHVTLFKRARAQNSKPTVYGPKPAFTHLLEEEIAKSLEFL